MSGSAIVRRLTTRGELPDYGSFGIAVVRKHALKWLFHREKATLHDTRKVYVYSETALRPVFPLNLQGEIRLLVHAPQKSSVAGVVPDGIEQRVHADESHVEAVPVERVLE